MNSTEIAFLSATETARAVKAKELSPTDAAQAYLERIDRLDSRLAAYINILERQAMGIKGPQTFRFQTSKGLT